MSPITCRYHTLHRPLSGQCLNFNCAFVLVLMLRQCITFLRTRGFGAFLPLDNHIYLHKMTGCVIAAFSLVHTLAHVLNFGLVVVHDADINAGNYTMAEWMLTARPGVYGLMDGWANPTGVLMAIILTVIFVCSQPFVRRGGSFEIFYWTHLLYVPFWLLVIAHGPNYWKWFIGPFVINMVERTLKLVWMRSGGGRTYISSGLLLPSKVTHLVIKRPLHFYFRPGDYVFVNIPAIAKYEWHPFTLSSAPEQEDYMWLHIRGVGEWTNRLYAYFEREQERLHSGDVVASLAGCSAAASRPALAAGNESNTPQRDFLLQNLARHPHGAMVTTTTTSINPNVMQIGDEEFGATVTPANRADDGVLSVPLRPPRSGPGTSKLALDNFSACNPPTSAATQPAEAATQTTIRKIQASLQRTFSRKGSATAASIESALGGSVAGGGSSNDGFEGDDGLGLRHTVYEMCWCVVLDIV